MPNGTSERSALIEHCGVGGSVRKGTLYPIVRFGSQAQGSVLVVHKQLGLKNRKRPEF